MFENGVDINCTTSTAEETRKDYQSHVVKAFNTVFAKKQSTG
jgi:predicted dinucleotide-binding enzyme